MNMKLTPMGNIQNDIDERQLSLDQTTNMALYGSNYNQPGKHDSTRVYNAGETVVYIDSNGITGIYYAKHGNTSGKFNLNDWEQYNIFTNQYDTNTKINNLNVSSLLGL